MPALSQQYELTLLRALADEFPNVDFGACGDRATVGRADPAQGRRSTSSATFTAKTRSSATSSITHPARSARWSRSFLPARMEPAALPGISDAGLLPRRNGRASRSRPDRAMRTCSAFCRAHDCAICLNSSASWWPATASSGRWRSFPPNTANCSLEMLHEPTTERDPSSSKRSSTSCSRRGRALHLVHLTGRLVRNLAIYELIIGGDCWDRGPRGDRVVDYLRQQPNVSFIWGNHDAAWLGAALGHEALICHVLRVSLRYRRLGQLDEGYSIPLTPLEHLARTVYADDPAAYLHAQGRRACGPIELVARMQKAAAIMQFKLEGQMIARNPHWEHGAPPAAAPHRSRRPARSRWTGFDYRACATPVFRRSTRPIPTRCRPRRSCAWTASVIRSSPARSCGSTCGTWSATGRCTFGATST